jgi:hypothetical protein
MSNKIVTSIYNVIDDNIEQVNDTRIICIDIAKGFVGLHKSDPVCTLDVNGTINCQYLYINDVSINTIINSYNLLNTNLIPLNDNTINLGTATKYWLNAYIYDLSAESIDVVANINPFTNATGSLGSTSKYWGNSYIRDLSVISIDVSINFNPLTNATGSIGSFSKYIRNAYIRSISLESIDISINLNSLVHGTGSLGSTSKNWSNAYINDLSVGSVDVSVNLNPLINGSGSLGVTNKIWGNAYIYELSAGSIDVSVNLSPLIPGTGSLGSTTKYWNNAYINDLSVTSINTISNENVIIDIIPQNDTESLGLSNKKWGNAYIRNLSVQSIDISVNLNMKNNNIININKLTGDVSNNIITTTSRIYQEISGDISWNAVNGYYGLAKDAYPSLNSLSGGIKAISKWTISKINYNSRSQSVGLGCVCWSGKLGIFVAIGTDVIMRSYDGINWNVQTSISGSAITICWSDELDLFVAVPYGNNYILLSNDGIVWRKTTQGVLLGGPSSICWSPQLGLFVILSGEGFYQVLTSTDGNMWIGREIKTSSSNRWLGVCWSPQLKLFLGVASISATSNDVYTPFMTSPDGINWTMRSIRLDFIGNSNFESVCWSVELGMFIIGGPQTLISYDGITFTPIIGDVGGSSICWSPELQLFVYSANDYIYYSHNGINWNTYYFSENTNYLIQDICWSSELGIFIGVGLDTDVRVPNYEHEAIIIRSSLKGRPPTSYNVFDSSFNSIDESGNWTFSKITTPTANIIDLSVNSINGQECRNLIYKINMLRQYYGISG